MSSDGEELTASPERLPSTPRVKTLYYDLDEKGYKPFVLPTCWGATKTIYHTAYNRLLRKSDITFTERNDGTMMPAYSTCEYTVDQATKKYFPYNRQLFQLATSHNREDELSDDEECPLWHFVPQDTSFRDYVWPCACEHDDSITVVPSGHNKIAYVRDPVLWVYGYLAPKYIDLSRRNTAKKRRRRRTILTDRKKWKYGDNRKINKPK